MDFEPDTIFPREATGRDNTIRNLYRNGKVVERIVDDTQVSVRVQWLDKQNIISRPIPVKQFGSKGTSAFWCPKVGDDVSVNMLPNSNGGEGFVDGSFYNVGNPPPITDPDTRHTTFADGTVIEYAEGAPVARGAEAMEAWRSKLVAGGRNGGSTLKVDNKGPINIICAGTCTITAPNVIINGPVQIVGNLTVSGDITATGVIMDSGGNTNHHSH
jgi:phage baseplate assembly protein V